LDSEQLVIHARGRGQDVASDVPAQIQLSHCSMVLQGRAVLEDVSFVWRRGERWALLGPNGSGKTLFMKMLRGDVWPTPTGTEQRSYCFDGEHTRSVALIKHRITYVGPERQDKYLRYGWNHTVRQVVTTGLFDEDVPLTAADDRQQARVDRVLRRFKLWRLRGRRLLSLSYGQRRLVLVARAFAGPARVLLLDEVFNGLDASTRAALRRALERRGRHDWLLSSHRVEELPASVTHVARLEAGRLVAAGSLSGALPADAGAMQLPQLLPAPLPRPAACSDSSWLFEIRNAALYRAYRPVLRDLNWTVQRAEHWAVLGANGSGKSSLLSLIHGDLHPAFGGSIRRAGVPLGTHIEHWKSRVGWVSPELQADHCLAESIEEIVISGLYASIGLNAPATQQDRARVQPWLRFFGIEALKGRGPREVSYGQMRLALLARAMVNQPELLLLDEPCTGLDPTMRQQVLGLLQHLADHGTQVVMAVHEVKDMVPAINWILRIDAGTATVSRRE
jgi:molybdate transport system ATP-binding protein